MATAKQTYTEDDIAALVSILGRQSSSIGIDADELRGQLMDLMIAVGRAAGDGPEGKRFWDAFLADQPSHAAITARYRAIAEAPDPFAPEVMTDEERAQMKALAYGRWPPRRSHAGAGQYGPSERDLCLALLRQLALRVARHHRGFVRRGAPAKSDQETILLELADIYCLFAGLSSGRYDLPHAVNTRFIAFAHVAMRPFFDTTEVTPKALSHCWKKLKDQHLAGAPRSD